MSSTELHGEELLGAKHQLQGEKLQGRESPAAAARGGAPAARKEQQLLREELPAARGGTPAARGVAGWVPSRRGKESSWKGWKDPSWILGRTHDGIFVRCCRKRCPQPSASRWLAPAADNGPQLLDDGLQLLEGLCVGSLKNADARLKRAIGYPTRHVMVGREPTHHESAELMTPSSCCCRTQMKRNTKNTTRRKKTCCNPSSMFCLKRLRVVVL